MSVTSVSTSISKGKTKRNKFGVYRRSDFKKAFVSLKQGDEIKFEAFHNECYQAKPTTSPGRRFCCFCKRIFTKVSHISL